MLVALALASCAPSIADSPINEQWRSVALDVQPVDLGEERVGVLHFRGGLELSSDDPRFGGLSGMEVLEDGRLIAVSDDGSWFSAQLSFDEEGRLIGLRDARLAPMRNEDGVPFPEKNAGDAEDITQMPDGRFAVSFEQSQSIRIYDLNRDGPFGAAVRGPLLAETERLPSNAGLESIASAANGDLIVGAEDTGALWRLSLDVDGPQPPVAHYPLSDGFALVSLDRMPGNDDFVALERFYAPVIGVRTRITRIATESIAGGGDVRLTTWASLAPPMSLDNFEAISITRGPDGGLRLYILSDDNFSAQQRTLLYAFDAALD